MPTTVTAFGLTPARSSARLRGSSSRAVPALPTTLRIFAMMALTIAVGVTALDGGDTRTPVLCPNARWVWDRETMQ
ncbi:hypothetical protein GCM10009679_17270 [Saccharothrix algeriensis]|uniref:Uncharacterized protein n=1 Tax=Catellatospora bangladeshensis TaxID=310355 RepID=A0A8J3NMN4_9ACTN|nr:hypothetical protein Cba03nite_53090 [Catellatospora bangladeshensis]